MKSGNNFCLSDYFRKDEFEWRNPSDVNGPCPGYFRACARGNIYLNSSNEVYGILVKRRPKTFFQKLKYYIKLLTEKFALRYNK